MSNSSKWWVLRPTVGMKMAMLGMLALIGLIALGGIGYWANGTIAAAGRKALTSEQQARRLSELNGQLIALMSQAVDSPAHPEKGIGAEQVIAVAQDLAKKAQQAIEGVPGADEVLVEKSKLTLGGQIVGNFNDVADALTYELPALYAFGEDKEGLARAQGDLALSLSRFYEFIARSLGRLAANASAEAETSREEMAATASQARTAMFTVFACTLAILIPLFALFRSNIVSPLRKTAIMAEALKRGHVNARLDVGKRNDEFGAMAAALNDFADSLEHEVAAVMHAIAGGDLTVEARPKDEGDVIRGALKTMRHELSVLVGNLRDMSSRVTASAAQVSDASQTLSDGATRQASALEEISASMQELTQQTRQNAENAAVAHRVAGEVRGTAADGTARMHELLQAMEDIHQAGSTITGIVKTIDEIAFQTNLLALNASVEAARAGQHGRGFAVVAEEVRNLAGRSARAARETAELVQGTVSKTSKGKVLAHRSAEALDSIERGITSMTDLVAEIAAASDEQAQGVIQTNQGLEQINLVTQRNTATSEESASAAQELSHLAVALDDMISRFRVEEGGEKPSLAARRLLC